MASDLDHIRFLGERDDLWRIMPHLDVLWNGSDNRSVSVAILEAMAAGMPVVASDVPVNRELVIHGKTGYLIPIGRHCSHADEPDTLIAFLLTPPYPRRPKAPPRYSRRNPSSVWTPSVHAACAVVRTLEFAHDRSPTQSS